MEKFGIASWFIQVLVTKGYNYTSIRILVMGVLLGITVVVQKQMIPKRVYLF